MNTPGSEQAANSKPVVVKKYANRRLYNTATSSYVTLEDLAKMIKDGGDFIVHDAKTKAAEAFVFPPIAAPGTIAGQSFTVPSGARG